MDNIFDLLNKNKSEQPTTDIVEEAKNAPVRPEYLQLLEKFKKEQPETSAGASFLGAPSAEDLALRKMQELDEYKQSPEQFSAFSGSKLASLQKSLDTPTPAPQEQVVDKIPATVAAPSPAIQATTPTRAPASVPTSTSQESVIPKELLALAKPMSGSPYGADLDDAALKAAQQQMSDQLFQTNMIKAATQIGASTAGGKADTSGIDAIQKLAGQGVDNIQARRKSASEELKFGAEKELEDPNGPASKLTREMLKKHGGLTIPDNISAGQLKRAGIDVDKMMLMKDARDAKAADKAKNPTVSKAQETVDRKFGSEYNDFVTAGGFEDAQKGIQQLKEAASLLKKKNLTGPIIGYTPDPILSMVNPDAISTREAVQEIVQRNLRLVLGPQFTAKEGELLLDRAYNPKLSEEENQKRINRIVTQIEGAAKAKLNAAKYYEEKGTLQGFKGTLVNSINDFDPESDNQQKERNITKQNNEVERKTADGKIAVFDSATKKFLRFK